jgi:eukaryotic-like serine/threonine-protein kinase
VDELDARVDALVKAGKHAEAADLCVSAQQHARAGDLYAAVWQWDEAVAITEQAGLFDLAYRHALAAKDRDACGRILELLEDRPDQAVRAAVHAESKGILHDAARLREAAGEIEAAADLYERGGEYREAARTRIELGQHRRAGMLLERRIKEDPEDGESALELGRILAQFGRWEHAVRALQSAGEHPDHEAKALRLLIACFAAMGMDEAAGSRLDELRTHEPALPLTVPDFLEREFGDRRGFAALIGDSAQALLAGRYRVIRPLGAGATGRVLLAHDAFHDREVAVKVLNVGGGALGRDAFVRFAREARVAAGISHPNVVPVYEFNPDGPFLVMEYMAGGTLEDRLVGSDEKAKVFPAASTYQMLKSVLAALEVVHRRGVVHRDLKPANIFFDAGGNVKLGDFGVAHLTDLGATLTGALVGTLAYMAPEQITGSARPDAATDAYAIGIILFRCLTGRLPFEGPDFVAQHLEATAPAPSSIAPWLGEGFDALIAKLLSKEPSARYTSATELLDALRHLPWSAVEAPPAPPLESRPVPRPSDPPPSLAADRYMPFEKYGEIMVAKDELLERFVELVAIDAAAAERLRAFARADGPFIQAVYEVDETLGRAVLEHPSGERLDRLPENDPRRAAVPAQLRRALQRLHLERVVHGSVDPTQVVVGAARVCLRISLVDKGADPQLDWTALDGMGGRGAPR